MSLGLRARQAVALGAAVLLVVAGSTVAHLASVARIALRVAVEEGELLARQLYHQSSRVVAESPLADPLLIQRDPGIRAMLEGIVGYSHTVVYAAIVDPSDRILAHSNPKLDGERLPPQESLDQVKTWWTLRRCRCAWARSRSGWCASACRRACSGRSWRARRFRASSSPSSPSASSSSSGWGRVMCSCGRSSESREPWNGWAAASPAPSI